MQPNWQFTCRETFKRGSPVTSLASVAVKNFTSICTRRLARCLRVRGCAKPVRPLGYKLCPPLALEDLLPPLHHQILLSPCTYISSLITKQTNHPSQQRYPPCCSPPAAQCCSPCSEAFCCFLPSPMSTPSHRSSAWRPSTCLAMSCRRETLVL
jgi:hypothetical protein